MFVFVFDIGCAKSEHMSLSCGVTLPIACCACSRGTSEERINDMIKSEI